MTCEVTLSVCTPLNSSTKFVVLYKINVDLFELRKKCVIFNKISVVRDGSLSHSSLFPHVHVHR